MLRPYSNEPLTDFSQPENRQAFQAALDAAKAEIGGVYPLVIGGETTRLDDTFPSLNPSRPSEIVGYFANGGAEHADAAIEAAAYAFRTWRYTPVAERVRYLLGAAAEMRRRKHEFSAIMVLEVGKNWAEADIDTAEAIDFLEYYARQALRLTDSSALLAVNPPEQLSFEYTPLGVGAIIPPWNFPNAIAAGMTAAAIVTGNTAVLKPAEQSPWVAYKICQLFWDAGLPKGVLNYITGPGEIVGARMVEHPETRFIAFTGSRDVGVGIYATSAKVQAGQRWLKRAILEMGGKNAVIVDETADLESAAQGLIASAFGYQGQKCSAASRAIISEEVYTRLSSRVVELAEQLTVGPSDAPDVNLGPVIEADALKRIKSYIELGTQEAELLTGGLVENPDGGYFVKPTIFGEVTPDSKLAQDEIFGPVLSLIRARDFDDALNIANGTAYGLTGSVYSQDRSRLERARHEFHVGNLYINRKCTGAMVGVHPFGGFDMSGTDSKAGGPDYLLLFTQAKSIGEKL